VNAFSHSHIDLLLPHIQTLILPTLYAETIPSESYVRIVDLGPFKHKIDDGLPLRKQTFQCLDILIDVCFEMIHFNEFILQIRNGLTDHDDVQILCYSILQKLSNIHAKELLETLEELPPIIMKGVREKLKEVMNKNKQYRTYILF
jgi:cullin-associated NEDD8-dissociated protein 1